MKLEQAVRSCKRLVKMPYNKLNLDSYREKISKTLKLKELGFKDTSARGAIKLMSGQHRNAGIIHAGTGPTRKKRVVLVGKGILFDAGGYDMKPPRKFVNSKIDMAGMASVFSAAAYLSDGNVAAWCPVSTNLVADSQILPGDELRIGGRTVIISNTDAEGRLVLAEALSALEQRSRDILITIATLTGAVGYAVGDRATGVFTLNDGLYRKLRKSADKANELVWRLPMWEYLEKKHFSKKRIKNSVKERPGASTAALFLKQFVKYPEKWIHLDIAYSCWDGKKDRPTGQPVSTLTEFIKSL